jgi:hypothetical protein
MNILIKLMSIVSLIIAPHIALKGDLVNNGMMHNKQGMECSMNESDCCKNMKTAGAMSMSCEKDNEGNCVIDTAIWSKWMAEGKVVQADCMGMTDGKCHVKSETCERIMQEKEN